MSRYTTSELELLALMYADHFTPPALRAEASSKKTQMGQMDADERRFLALGTGRLDPTHERG
jgi:hypothetical protein